MATKRRSVSSVRKPKQEGVTTNVPRGRSGRRGKAVQRQQPWGREEVMAAVLDAATLLFAARGPAAVSVRDIAAAAHVNHALVHRHFGTKHDMLRAVLAHTAQEMATVAAAAPDSRTGIARLFAASVEHEVYWRALARAILDGEDPRALQREFPTIQRLIELLHSERQSLRRATPNSSPPPLEVRVGVGTLSALILGWLVFEPYLLAATGLAEHDRAEVRQQVVQMLQSMVERTLTV